MPIFFNTIELFSMNSIFKERRISKMDLHEVYFGTNTVKDWKHLLKPDKYKQFIIGSPDKLVKGDFINVYAFCPDFYRGAKSYAHNLELE